MRSLLLSLLVALPALAFAQGSLTPPPGAPAPTMKTLAQIEPRTPLQAGSPGVAVNGNGGFTISAPGSYYLIGNLTVASGNGVAIDADNVTLDLGGFTIASSSPTSNVAIFLSTSHKSIVIRNGHLSGTGTVSTSGTFSGAGFANGIFCSETLQNCLVTDLTITGIASVGIFLDAGSTIERCTAVSCGGIGIRGQVIANCSATACGGIAIQGTTVSNSQGASITGAAILATTAINCIGSSTTGIGLKATQSAANCAGTTQTGAYGLRVATDDTTPILGTAESCKGTAAGGTGIGLSAGTVTNSIGTAAAGIGLEAIIATSCHGKSENGAYGLHAETTATGCTGVIVNGNGPTGPTYYSSDIPRGLSAYSAENCVGSIGLYDPRTGVITGTASGTNIGLDARTAANCTGTIWAPETPNTSIDGSSTGLNADSASNCSGVCKQGYGINCVSATNCSGASETNIGLRAYHIASFCNGTTYNPNTYAISARIAVACAGIGTINVTQADGKQLGTP